MKNYLIGYRRKLESLKNLEDYRKKIEKKYRKKKIRKLIEEIKINLDKYFINLKIEGIIKKYPEDFIVEEITKDGIILEYGKDLGIFKDDPNWKGAFIHFTLEKINWNTLDAIGELVKRTNSKRKNFGFAGTKDKYAATTQRVGCFGIKVEALERIKDSIKGIKIRDIQRTNKKLKLGDLWGNRFTIKVRLKDRDPQEVVDILKDIKLNYILNYYGIQRFGTDRPITHIVGKLIYNRDFEGAFYAYCGTPLFEEGRVREARKLVDEGDFKGALKMYPKELYYERKMLKRYLETGSFIKSFKVLPPHLRCMFINAYQSYLFNEMINRRFQYGFEPQEGDILFGGIPTGAVLGRKCRLAEGIQGEIERDIIEEEGIDLQRFYIEDFGDFPGTRRRLITKVYDFTFWAEEDGVVLRFKLEKGCYATVLLREFIKDDKNIK
ncbi:tRNA pseudouridine(13) synthase TruD [Methanofervidicoccus abyssi]|uniref:Probable tRNA pseudouridine synthase D n=1 Tax=Methanofervidicoccus abyssi TaxID=2082189 RepID=A0A401HNK6_9EURY|nr:tRNA pseudouridine(13) synthase TruD [Methanofervidicoccus abyssi]GBF35818.1 tRNA pseudouridine13 synthase [Methanofervidicoccus abyssi]